MNNTKRKPGPSTAPPVMVECTDPIRPLAPKSAEDCTIVCVEICLSLMFASSGLVKSPADHVKLLLARELDEVHGVPANTYRQRRIFLRMRHRI